MYNTKFSTTTSRSTAGREDSSMDTKFSSSCDALAAAAAGSHPAGGAASA